MKLSTYEIVITALFAAILCVLGPLALPIGPIPISLATFVLYLSVMLLGTRLATISCCIYLLLGVAGLPVFSGFAGGLGKVAGPTGGFLVGYIPLVIVSGIAVAKWYEKPVCVGLGMILGTALLYALGTAWFVFQMKTGVWAALTMCVFPFLAGDFVKIVMAILVGRVIRKRLAGMLPK